MRKRSGTLIIVLGAAIALVAGLMVFSLARQASAQADGQVRQVYVVMAARDIPEGTAVAAEAVVARPFPANFVPQGAIAAPEQAVGKYTVARVTKGQIVLSNQVSTTRRAGNLSLSVPPGKVAVALPMTDLLSANGAIRPGDRIDVLLTLNAGVAASGARSPVTQVALQNVEVLAVGQADPETGTGAAQVTVAGQRPTPAVMVALARQDALILKYVKDSGGVVDLALRAPEDDAPAEVDPVTIDLLVERFGFRQPAP